MGAVPVGFVSFEEMREALREHHQKWAKETIHKASFSIEEAEEQIAEICIAAEEYIFEDLWDFIKNFSITPFTSIGQPLRTTGDMLKNPLEFPATNWFSFVDNRHIDISTGEILDGHYKGSMLAAKEVDWKKFLAHLTKGSPLKSKGGKPEHPAKALYAKMGFNRQGKSLKELSRYLGQETNQTAPSASAIRNWEKAAKAQNKE